MFPLRLHYLDVSEAHSSTWAPRITGELLFHEKVSIKTKIYHVFIVHHKAEKRLRTCSLVVAVFLIFRSPKKLSFFFFFSAICRASYLAVGYFGSCMHDFQRHEEGVLPLLGWSSMCICLKTH